MSRAMCRVCLAGSSGDDVRLFSIDDCLLEIYEKLTSKKLSAEDGKCNTLCYICYSHLQKCRRFSIMAHRSEKYLKDVNQEIGNMLKLMRVQTLSVIYPMPISLDGLVTIKKEQLVLKNKPTSFIEKDSAKVRLFETSIKKGVIKNKVTVNDETIKIEKAQDFNKKEASTEDKIKIETAQEVNKKKVTTKDEFIKIETEQDVNSKEVNIEITEVEFDENYIITNEDLNDSKTSLVNKDTHKDITDVKKHIVINNTKLYNKNDLCNTFATREDQSTQKSSHKKKSDRKSSIKRFTGQQKRNNKKESCPICNKMMASSSIVAHMQIHTGERPFICDICGHSSRKKTYLDEHIKIHTGEKVLCKVCNKGFTQAGSLGKHMLIHTGEAPYSCHICGKSFKQSGTMRSHVRFVHEKLRQHSCDICSKKYFRKSELRKHMNTHSNEQAYSCDKCQTKFMTNSDKNRHMKLYCKKITTNEAP